MEDPLLDDHLFVPQDIISSQLYKLGLAQDTEVLWAGQPTKGNTATSIWRFIIGWLGLIMFMFTLNFFNASKDLIGMTFLGAFLASVIFIFLLFISAVSEQAEIKDLKKTHFYLLTPNAFYLTFDNELSTIAINDIEEFRLLDNKVSIDSRQGNFELTYLEDAKNLLNLLEEQKNLTKDD
ncbi:MAG: hypothetical protein GY810_00780 [Aureispira sp.]|nr:hypothetical protein [Aureispira sp.]